MFKVIHFIPKMIEDIFLIIPFKLLTEVMRKQLYSSEVRNYNKIVIHKVGKCRNWHLPRSYLLIASDLDSGM